MQSINRCAYLPSDRAISFDVPASLLVLLLNSLAILFFLALLPRSPLLLASLKSILDLPDVEMTSCLIRRAYTPCPSNAPSARPVPCGSNPPARGRRRRGRPSARAIYRILTSRSVGRVLELAPGGFGKSEMETGGHRPMIYGVSQVG